MGIEKNIEYDKFPKQGDWFGKEVEVIFHHDRSRIINGKIIRDDIEKPFKTIIELSDGRYILSTECQYRPLD